MPITLPLKTNAPPPLWENIIGKPYITVSGKGIANGLSDKINDGADFGPDTPGTTSDGLQEAWNYAVSVGVFNPYVGSAGAYQIPEIHIVSDITISAPVTFSGNGKLIADPTLKGSSSMSPYIICKVNNNYVITYDPSSFNYVNIRIENIQFVVSSGYTPEGAIYLDFSSANSYTNVLEIYNIAISSPMTTNWTTTPIYANAFEQIYAYNYESYSTSGAMPGGYFTALYFIGFFGGSGLSSLTTIGGTSSNPCAQVNLIGFGAPVILNYAQNVSIVGYLEGGNGIEVNGTIGSLIVINTSMFSPQTVFIHTASSATIDYLVIDGMTFENVSTPTTFSLVSGVTVNNIKISGIVPNTNVTVTYPNITSVAGPTAGTVKMNETNTDQNYKKVMITFSGYENNTTTNQSISFPFPFSTIAAITANTTGLSISTTTSGITITSPNSTTTYNGVVIIEGY